MPRRMYREQRCKCGHTARMHKQRWNPQTKKFDIFPCSAKDCDCVNWNVEVSSHSSPK